MAKETLSRVLVRTDFGRWVWWPGLQIVDYIPKGRRVPSLAVHLTARQDTEIGALRAVVRELSGKSGGK